jgi:hypothetical protein
MDYKDKDGVVYKGLSEEQAEKWGYVPIKESVKVKATPKKEEQEEQE